MAETFSVDPDAHAKAKSGDLAYHDDAEGKPVVAKTELTLGPDDDDKVKVSDVDPGETEEEAKTEGDETPEDKAAAADADKPDADTDKPDADADKAEADKVIEKYQTQLQGWTTEFIEKGDLTEETAKSVMDTIFKDEVPPEIRAVLLDAFKEGITSTTQVSTLKGWDMVGGQEQYVAMATWAKANLSPEEIAAFDAAATGADVGLATTAIKGLHARYQQARGVTNEPDLAHSATKAPAEPIIGSRQELARLVGTKEYQTDPALRARVDRQLDQSMKSGKYTTS